MSKRDILFSGNQQTSKRGRISLNKHQFQTDKCLHVMFAHRDVCSRVPALAQRAGAVQPERQHAEQDSARGNPSLRAPAQPSSLPTYSTSIAHTISQFCDSFVCPRETRRTGPEFLCPCITPVLLRYSPNVCTVLHNTARDPWHHQ